MIHVVIQDDLNMSPYNGEYKKLNFFELEKLLVNGYDMDEEIIKITRDKGIAERLVKELTKVNPRRRFIIKSFTITSV
jgi:hypothetical protein